MLSAAVPLFSGARQPFHGRLAVLILVPILHGQHHLRVDLPSFGCQPDACLEALPRAGGPFIPLQGFRFIGCHSSAVFMHHPDVELGFAVPHLGFRKQLPQRRREIPPLVGIQSFFKGCDGWSGSQV